MPLSLCPGESKYAALSPLGVVPLKAGRSGFVYVNSASTSGVPSPNLYSWRAGQLLLPTLLGGAAHGLSLMLRAHLSPARTRMKTSFTLHTTMQNRALHIFSVGRVSTHSLLGSICYRFPADLDRPLMNRCVEERVISVCTPRNTSAKFPRLLLVMLSMTATETLREIPS